MRSLADDNLFGGLRVNVCFNAIQNCAREEPTYSASMNFRSVCLYFLSFSILYPYILKFVSINKRQKTITDVYSISITAVRSI